MEACTYEIEFVYDGEYTNRLKSMQYEPSFSDIWLSNRDRLNRAASIMESRRSALVSGILDNAFLSILRIVSTWSRVSSLRNRICGERAVATSTRLQS